MRKERLRCPDHGVGDGLIAAELAELPQLAHLTFGDLASCRIDSAMAAFS